MAVEIHMGFQSRSLGFLVVVVGYSNVRVRRYRASGIFSTSLLAVAFCLAQQAKAQNVIAYVTGTVSSGTDTSETGNVFGVGTNLAGMDFSLLYVMDQSRGSAGSSSCTGGGSEYSSNVTNTSSSNPSIATLTITNSLGSGNSFTIGGGTFGQSSIVSNVLRYAQTSCYSYSNLGFGVQANYGGSYSGTAYVGATSGPTIYPVPTFTGSFSSDADWFSGFTVANTTTSVTIPFVINISLSVGGTAGYAYGYLSPSNIYISNLNIPAKNIGGFGGSGSTESDPVGSFGGGASPFDTGGTGGDGPSASSQATSPGGSASGGGGGGNGVVPCNGTDIKIGYGQCEGAPAAMPPLQGHSGGAPACDQCSSTGMSDSAVSNTGSTTAGDPIDPATGNMFKKVTDYRTAGPNPLSFMRYYNSRGNAMSAVSGSSAPFYNAAFAASMLGINWRSNYDRNLNVASLSLVYAERPDGSVLTFNLSGSTWTPDTDVDYTLTNSGSTYTLTDNNDTVETYTVTSGKGLLQTIAYRNGFTLTMSYTSGDLTTVTDSYSRTLTMTWSGALLSTLSTPDGLTITYGYNSSGQNGTANDRLISVSYNTTPTTSQTYLYANASFPFEMTGIQDENGNTYLSWTYDINGRATSSSFGSSVNTTTIAYTSSTTSTVTNALGVTDTYTFSLTNGMYKVTQISRASTSTTAAATRTFTYDSNGYLATATDWNGNQTNYTNNSNGQPTSITEAYGSGVARTTTIAYDTTWVHLPATITTTGVTSTFIYDSNGNLLTHTDTDTTSGSTPYSTNGQTRVTTYTWSSTGQPLTVQLPRTDLTVKTTYTYSSGALASVTDGVGNVTTISSATGGGLPLTIVDPNSVTTTLVYDGRLRLNTTMLHRSSTNLVTILTHDAAGNLTSLQLPDSSQLSYTYDTARRLTTITDLNSNTINYTLDALGDITATAVKNSVGTTKNSGSATFDALGRKLTYTGGVSGETTTFTYDKNANVLTIEDPNSNSVTRTYDALNRLSTSVDPSPGGTTTITYDVHDRVTNVQDANSNTTSYTYDGFGDLIQIASPDSGTTVFYYDPDRNLTNKVLPGSMTANMTYDADDRWLTSSYPSDSTLNISNTYDQTTGRGDGVGRLTSSTDQAGSLSLTYEERGLITSESRTPSGVSAMTTAHGFDAAGRTSTITYPSGTAVSYTRNNMGRITAVSATPYRGSATNVATSIAYNPFGPVSGLSFGNGITGTYAYDNDYRTTSRIDAATANYLKLAYTYDSASNVTGITDSVNSANSWGSTSYDALERLTAAISGTGGYGSYSWTWDPVNNVKTQVVNGTTTTFSLNSGSSQLSQWVASGTTTTVASTSPGNMHTLTVGGTVTTTFDYNQANRMSDSTVSGLYASYLYDLTGRRIQTSPSGSNTVYFTYDRNSGNLLAENDLHSGAQADYIYLNGTPIGEITPSTGALVFTHTDRMGAPNTVTDSTKTVVWNALYTPLGDTGTSATGTLNTQSLRLPGQEQDAAAGTFRNGFRTYDPSTTRYLESDPIGLGGGMNTFQYVRGNPWRGIDPSGLTTYSPSTIGPLQQGDNWGTKSCGASNQFPPPLTMSPLDQTLWGILGNNPIMNYVGDNPDTGWELVLGGAALANAPDFLLNAGLAAWTGHQIDSVLPNNFAAEGSGEGFSFFEGAGSSHPYWLTFKLTIGGAKPLK
jgi:RHS repeat-associated protein